MDLILHILWGIVILGADCFVVIGSTLPDLLYLIAAIINGFDMDKLKDSTVFVWGERTHSFLFIPIILIALYLFLGWYAIIKLLAGYYLHLLLDVITHRDFGPRFLWPLYDSYYPRGLVQWEDKKVLSSLYIIIIAILVTKYIIFAYK